MINEILIVVTVFLLIAVYALFRWNRGLKKRMDVLAFSKQSLSSKYGRMSEQFMPFLAAYPYDKNNFRFIGTPIDGVQFEDDKIVFVEFKTSNSKLTTRQRLVKNLVKDGRIEFREFRI